MTLPVNYQDARPPTGALTEIPATTSRGLNAITAKINANTAAIATHTTAIAANTTAIAGLEFGGTGVVNVKDYGAKGDGSTDDSAAVTAAIAAVVAARASFPGPALQSAVRSVVFFPPGAYLFGAQTLTEGVFFDGDTARLRPTAGFTGIWLTINGHYAGLGPGVWLNGNNVNGEVALKITTSSYQVQISCSFSNWAGKCIRDEGVCTHIDSALVQGMLNTTYINSLSAGSYVGVVELAGTDSCFGKVEINAVRTSGGHSVVASTNRVVVCLFVPGGMIGVDGAICEQGDIGILNTGFFNKYKNTRTEFNTTHGFWALAGSGEIVGCQSLGNGRLADNTYDGFFIDTPAAWLFSDNVSRSDNPGDSIKHRYGLNCVQSEPILGKFISTGGDHNAYRDGVNSVTYPTAIDADPKARHIRDTNGNIILSLEATASATTYVGIYNSTSLPLIQAIGTTNGDIGFVSNGTGGLYWFQSSGSAVNLGAHGAATDISWNFNTQGAGRLRENNVPVATRLTNTATLDFGSVSAASQADLTITVTGAATGDAVALGIPTASVTAGIVFSAWVSATDTVTVRAHNYTAGALDPASGAFKAVIVR